MKVLKSAFFFLCRSQHLLNFCAEQYGTGWSPLLLLLMFRDLKWNFDIASKVMLHVGDQVEIAW